MGERDPNRPEVDTPKETGPRKTVNPDTARKVGKVATGGAKQVEVPGGKNIVVFRPDTSVGWSF